MATTAGFLIFFSTEIAVETRSNRFGAAQTPEARPAHFGIEDERRGEDAESLFGERTQQAEIVEFAHHVRRTPLSWNH